MQLLSLFGQSTYNYNYDTTSGTDVAATAGAFVFVIILLLVAYVITSYLLSRIFAKAGVEPWKAWVPVYNNWVMLELGGQQGFWAVLAFVPFISIASFVFMIIAMYHIGLKFGKSGSFVLLAIFLPIVWLIWLAFDKSIWQGARPVADTDAPAFDAAVPQPTPQRTDMQPGNIDQDITTPQPEQPQAPSASASQPVAQETFQEPTQEPRVTTEPEQSQEKDDDNNTPTPPPATV